MTETDRNKSLEELDGRHWGEPEYDSGLVHECHRLRRVPLREFTVENLRIMIGQDIGLEYLIPIALEHLERDPFVEGFHYPCDLLANALRADKKFWRQQPELAGQLLGIAERAIELFPERPDDASPVVVEAVTSAFERFRRQQA